MNLFNPKGKQTWGVEQVFKRGRPIGACVKRCFGQPGDQPGVFKGQCRSGGVDPLFAAFLQYAPVQERTQNATGRPDNGLPFAILLADSPLDMGGRG